MATTNQGESGGTARPAPARVHRHVDTAAYEARVAQMLRGMALAPGWRTWATVRLDGDDAVLQIRATTEDGSVVASKDVDLPVAARKAIDDAREEAEDALKNELLLSMARTFAAVDLNIGQET